MKFITADDKERLKLIKKYDQLDTNRHVEAFGVNLGHGTDKLIYTAMAFPSLISGLWADLLFNDQFEVYSKGAQNNVDELINDQQVYGDQDDFITSLWEQAYDHSKIGECVFKTYRDSENSVFIEPVPSQIYFPVYSASNNRKTSSRRIINTFKQNDIVFIYVEEHFIGRVEHRFYQVTNKNSEIYTLVDNLSDDIQVIELPINKLYEITGDEAYKNLPASVDTGIEDYLVHCVPNMRSVSEARGRSDYIPIIDPLKETENRLMQISNVLEQHAAPDKVVPPNTLKKNKDTGNWEYRVEMKDNKRGRIYESGGNAMTPETSKPEYITWDGKLDVSFNQLEYLLRTMCMTSEIPMSIFGLDDAPAESGKAQQQRWLRALAKRERKRRKFDFALRRMINIGLQLMGKEPAEDLTIEWGTGLPIDEEELAQSMQAKIAAGIMSIERGVREDMRGASEEDVQAELLKLQKEKPDSLANAESNLPEVTL